MSYVNPKTNHKPEGCRELMGSGRSLRPRQIYAVTEAQRVLQIPLDEFPLLDSLRYLVLFLSDALKNVGRSQRYFVSYLRGFWCSRIVLVGGASNAILPAIPATPSKEYHQRKRSADQLNRPGRSPHRRTCHDTDGKQRNARGRHPGFPVHKWVRLKH